MNRIAAASQSLFQAVCVDAVVVVVAVVGKRVS